MLLKIALPNPTERKVGLQKKFKGKYIAKLEFLKGMGSSQTLKHGYFLKQCNLQFHRQYYIRSHVIIIEITSLV